jgi:hypothetical protein
MSRSDWSPTPAPERPATPVAPACDVDVLFDDLGAESPDPFAASPAAVTDAPATTAAPSTAAWPAGGPTADELDDQLARGMVGLFDAPPLGPVAERVVRALSPLERAVLGGEATELDPEVIRGAARMRLRVGAALAASPPKGSPIDADAVSALLAEIDALLASVSALAAGAASPQQASVDAIRSALIKEAIDLSEAAQALAPTAAAAVPASAPARTPRPGATRLLSVSTADAAAEPASRSARWMLVVLGIAVAAAASWHVARYRARHVEPAPLPTITGAPAGAIGVPAGKGTFLVRSATPKFTPSELDALREVQGAQGNTIEEVGPGLVMVRVRPSAAKESR